MPLLKKIRTIAAKTEGTIGTAESLTASEGVFNAYDVEINPDVEVQEREGQGAFNRLAGVAAARWGTMSFKVDMEYDGTTTMPNWSNVLFPACGVVETSQVYYPVSSAPGSNSVTTVTLASYIDGVKKTLAGAMGNCKIVMPNGRKVYLEFEFQGVWQAVTDTAIIAPTYPTDTVVRFASATATYNSNGLKVEEMTFDFGNQVERREDPSTAAGYISAIITDRMPTFTANPEAELVATDDRYGDILANTTAAMSVQLNGPAPVTTTSTVTLAAAKAQITSVTEGDRNKMIIDEVEWACTKNAANQDQEFSITFAESTA